MQLVGALHARGEYGMALGGVAADDEHQTGLLDIVDGARVATVPDSAEQPHGSRRLAISRAIIDVVGPDHGAGQLLHQEGFFVGAFRRGDEGQRVRTVRDLDLAETAGDQVQSLIPRGFAEAVTLADQRFGEAVLVGDEIPGEFALDARGTAICRPLGRLHFENVAVLGPDIEAASHAAISADRFCTPDAGSPHSGFRFGNTEDRGVAGFLFESLHHVDHAAQDWFAEARQEAGVADHALLHEGVARANRHAVAAGHAARLADRRAAIPEDAGMRILPAD